MDNIQWLHYPLPSMDLLTAESKYPYHIGKLYLVLRIESCKYISVAQGIYSSPDTNWQWIVSHVFWKKTRPFVGYTYISVWLTHYIWLILCKATASSSVYCLILNSREIFLPWLISLQFQIEPWMHLRSRCFLTISVHHQVLFTRLFGYPPVCEMQGSLGPYESHRYLMSALASWTWLCHL